MVRHDRGVQADHEVGPQAAAAGHIGEEEVDRLEHLGDGPGLAAVDVVDEHH
jgi:hypothetical protein